MLRTLLLGSRRQQAVQAKIHCSFGVVVGPSAGQDQAQPGARNLLSAESFRRLRQFRIVHFCQRVGAEIEGTLERGDEFVFRVRVVHLDFGSGDGGGLTAQQMIRFDHVGVELFLLPLAAAFALILDLFWRCDVLGLAVTK